MFNSKPAEYRTHVALCSATLDTLTWIHLSVSGNTICINQRLETICELVGPVIRWRILEWLHSVQNWWHGATAAFLHITTHLCYTSYLIKQADLSKKLRVAQPVKNCLRFTQHEGISQGWQRPTNKLHPMLPQHHHSPLKSSSELSSHLCLGILSKCLPTKNLYTSILLPMQHIPSTAFSMMCSP